MGGSNEFVECLGRGGVGEGALGAVAWLVGDGVEVGLVAGDGGSFGPALDAACECDGSDRLSDPGARPR